MVVNQLSRWDLPRIKTFSETKRQDCLEGSCQGNLIILIPANTSKCNQVKS